MTEQILEKGSREYTKLEIIASELTYHSKHGYQYKVEDTYLDFGQNWKWTTICRDSDWGGVQVLSPREWKEIMDAVDLNALQLVYDSIVNDKYFSDK